MSQILMQKQVGDIRVEMVDEPRFFVVKMSKDGKDLDLDFKTKCRHKAVKRFLDEVDILEAKEKTA